MRVHDQNLTGATAAEAGRTQEAQRASRGENARAGASGNGGDRVELSSTLNSVSRALASHHADRAARVQQLTALYQSGRHQPDSAKTSSAMVSEALSPAAG